VNEDKKMDGGGGDRSSNLGDNDDTNNGIGKNNISTTRLNTEEGSYTRCELTIQRVETHLLDPSPLSLLSLSRTLSNFGKGVDGAVAATEMRRRRGGGGD